MVRNDIATGFGGAIQLTKFTLDQTDLTAAATTQNINLLENPIPGGPVSITPNVNFQIPQGGVILGVRIKHEVAFTATSLTAMTVSVGKSGNNTFFASAFDVFQAVADTTIQESSMFKSGQLTAVPVTVTFTSTGANLNAATMAGRVSIYICWLNVSQAAGPSLTPGQSGGGGPVGPTGGGIAV